jgi:hypothetical protein
MKQSLFIVLLFSFISTALCQKSDKPNYISFSAGMNFPVASYAATDLRSSSSGFAKPGEYVSFSWAKLASEKIGYTVSLSGQRNPVDTKAMAEEFSKVLINTGIFGTGTPGVPVTEAGSYYPDWNFKKNSWLLASLQGGLYGEFPLSSSKNNIVVTAKLTAGAMYAKLPELTGQSITDTSNVIIYQSKNTSVGFAYTLGTGIKYRLDKKTFVLLNLNYWASGDLTFKNEKVVVTVQKSGAAGSSINQLQYTDNATQAFKSISASLGIGIQL